MNRKGIILAGGTGSRLFPITLGISKQLLPIYNKPMIYYPITTLIELGIKDILLITNQIYLNNYKNILKDGKHLGLNISYKIQNKPNGLAEALILADDFLNGSPSVLILGDNLFYLNEKNIFKKLKKNTGAQILLYKVSNPEDYGVAKIKKNKILDIVEKPKKFVSNYAVTGIYFYDKFAPKYAKKLTPSKRGELEITDLNKIYLKKNLLNYYILEEGSAWLDTGSHDSLSYASDFVRTLEKRQGILVGSLELASIKNKLVNKDKMIKYIKKFSSDYFKSLKKQVEEGDF